MSLILENLLQQLKAKTTEQLRQGTSSCLRKRHPSCPAAVFGFPGAALEESHRNFLAAAGATCSGPEQPGRVTRLAKSARRGRLYSPLSRARAGVEARLASPLRVPPLTAAYSHLPRSPPGCGHRPRRADRDLGRREAPADLGQCLNQSRESTSLGVAAGSRRKEVSP